VNFSTATLGAILSLGSSIAAKPTMQAQSNEPQAVDHVEVTKVTGTVQKVDTDKRMMTMKLDNGKRTTLKVDKRVTDLDQFKAGDRMQLSHTEEIIAMADRSDDGGASLAKYGAVDVEPEGDNPALVKVDTTEIKGKIVSVDPKKRRLTFEDPDGRKRTLTLGHKIKNLDQFKPGQTIDMAITDELVVEAVRT
jgi:Cu/Ag efflux protein CusF